MNDTKKNLKVLLSLAITFPLAVFGLLFFFRGTGWALYGVFASLMFWFGAFMSRFRILKTGGFIDLLPSITVVAVAALFPVVWLILGDPKKMPLISPANFPIFLIGNVVSAAPVVLGYYLYSLRSKNHSNNCSSTLLSG